MKRRDNVREMKVVDRVSKQSKGHIDQICMVDSEDGRTDGKAKGSERIYLFLARILIQILKSNSQIFYENTCFFVCFCFDCFIDFSVQKQFLEMATGKRN